MTNGLTLLLWIVKATMLLMLAMGMSMALRRAPAGARHLVWLATLVALLLTPAMSAWTPLPLRVLPSEPTVMLAGASVTNPFAGTPASSPQTAAAPVAAPKPAPLGAAPAPAVARVSPWTIALYVWATIAAAILFWLGLGAFAVNRILARARVLTGDAWLNPLYETADRLELDHAPRLVMSSSVEMPFACGILHPTIVLPMSAEEWTDERRRVVLFHELAHVRRRDLVGHTLGRLACAFYWFHPMVWSAAKQLRAESERACDDLVLACGAKASDYANHLLEIVTSVRRQGAPATALPMADKREFEGRMLAILDPSLKRATPNRAQKMLLTAGLGSFALFIAAAAPARRAPEPMATQTVERDSVDESQTQPASSSVTLHDGQERELQAPQPPQDALRDRSRTVATQRTETKTQATLNTWLSQVITSTATSASTAATKLLQGEQQGTPPDTALLGRILRTDKDAGVRKAAAWALHGRRDGVPLLVERLNVDEDGEVRETAAWALAGTSNPQALAALAKALRSDRDADTRGTAAWALGHSADADLAALEAGLGDTDPDVREKALWAMGHRVHTQAPPRVVAMLKDDDKDVRVMAAWVLGNVLDKQTIPALREAFIKETDGDVLEGEFRALLFMGDRDQAVIDRALKSDNPDLRARGVRMIAGQGPGVWPWPWPWPDPRPEP
jgi:beta-lactamase regulating signal transducer with metallopeptidase domain/HEAT repeat protein